MLPAVALGSLFVNLTTSNSLENLSIATSLAMMTIASGAAAEAAVGAWLLGKNGKLEISLFDLPSAIRFVVGGGFISCTVGATIGVLALYGAGVIGWKQVTFNWLTWWTGDSIGVILVAPMILEMARSRVYLGRRRIIEITLSYGAMLLLTVGLFTLVSHWERDKVKAEFDKKTRKLVLNLERTLEGSIGIIRSVQSLYNSSEHVNNLEFATFIDGLTQKEGLRAISWNPIVLREERPTFEAAGRKTGPKRFRITEFNSSGKIVEAAPRDFYVTPLYISPHAGNSSALGVNLMSDPTRREGYLRAMSTGNLAATSRISLLQTKAPGVLILAPVYKREGYGKGLQTPHGNLVGFVVGAFDLNQLMAVAFAHFLEEGLNVTVSEAHDSSGALFSQISDNQLSARMGFTMVSQISVADHKWELKIWNTDRFLSGRPGWEAWFVLAGGLAFMALFGLFLLLLSGRNASVEQLVRQRTEELEILHVRMAENAKMTSLGEMAAGIAHEINTPLASINMKTAVLRMRAEPTPSYIDKVVQSAVDIESTVNRIAQIIRGLRSFARDGQKDAFERTPVQSIVKDTLSFCGERFRAQNISLSFTDDGKELYVDCKPAQISQVLLNLLNNAFDAVQFNSQKWVSIAMSRVGDQVEISVTDSGHGIAESERGKIFQPFYTTKPVGTGTGLGLSISLGLVKVHQGSLHLDVSSPHTRFVITLPLAKSKVARAEGAA